MSTARIPIIQLVDGFATEEHSGGAAQFGIQLARHLDPQQFAVHVVGLWRYNTPSEQRWLKQLCNEGIGTSILIEQPKRLALDLPRAALFLNHIIKRNHTQILNSHFERGDLLALASKSLQLGQLKIVRTMHTEQQWQKRPWMGQLLNLAAFPWFFDQEIAISQTTREVMDARPAAKLRRRYASLIYNGVSKNLIDQSQAIPRQVNPNHQPRFAIIGRLAEQKGHRYFFEAAKQILSSYPQAEFWVIGHGELEHVLHQQVTELGIEQAVKFLGRRSDIPALLRQVDVMISASLWEGFPTVILEAMAACTPVVATDVSGSREMVQNLVTGRLVPMKDAMALAQASIWMLQHPEQTTTMVDTAWHHIQDFTLEQIALNYQQVYHQIIHSNT